jgi:hypothetical protein
MLAPSLVQGDMAEEDTPPTDGLVSLITSPITAAQVGEFATPAAPTELPALTGPAEGLIPVAHNFHNASTWLLARDAAGTLQWLGHFPEIGWQRKSPPPAGIQPLIHRGGQAQVLVLAVDENGQAHIHTYHTITDTWADMGATILPGTVTGVQPSYNGFIVSTRDADGLEAHAQLAIALTKRLLTWIDWAIIVVYLTFTAGIGYYFFVRQKKTCNADFFLGGRSIPWWAAGVSLYATGTSAISYIATPAKSFAENWQYLAANVVGMVGTIFVAIWIVPMIQIGRAHV